MIDGEVAFTIGNRSSVPDSAGVYVFYDLSGPIYVGKSQSLYERYLTHYEKSHNKRLRQKIRKPIGMLRFAWKELPEPKIEEEEIRWIHILNPEANILKYKK